jgi:hypothetical protein
MWTAEPPHCDVHAAAVSDGSGRAAGVTTAAWTFRLTDSRCLADASLDLPQAPVIDGRRHEVRLESHFSQSIAAVAPRGAGWIRDLLRFRE